MNILVLTYWSYKDALIQTYTLPYVRIIKKNITPGKIFLVTIENPFHKMDDEEWNIESVKLRKEGIELIRFKYDYFGLKMIFRFIKIFINLIKVIHKNDIKTIHSWCLTAGALGYILSITTKKPLIIDSYEPHAEAMVENGTWNKSSFKFKLLFWLEKKQSRHANTVIALTKDMRKYALKKYNATFKNYYIKPALVDIDKFRVTNAAYIKFRTELKVNDKIVCLYAGKLGGIYLEEEVFDFFESAYKHWGAKLKIFLLTNKNIVEVNKLISQKNIPKDCIEVKFVPHQEIQKYFSIADFAINPVKPVPSKKYCTSIKDGEYWAAGLPVVITKNISDDSDIIKDNNIGYVLKDLNKDEYRNACKHINSILSDDKEEIKKKIFNIAIKYRSFSIAENIYKEVYS